MDSVHFGSALRMLRITAGLSLRELARKIAVSPAYLSQIEGGKLPAPTSERIEKIAEVMGISPATLLDMSERLHPETRSLLHVHPEWNHFIQFAGEIGFSSPDIDQIVGLIGELGLGGFRKLIGYGRRNASLFKSEDAAEPFVQSYLATQAHIPFDEFVDRRLIFPNLALSKKKELLDFLVNKISRLDASLDFDLLTQRLLASERETSSGIGNGLAIPHLFVEGLEKRWFAIARVQEGLDFAAIDNKPVHLVCLILDSENACTSHLNLLAYLARHFQNPEIMEGLLKARTKNDIVSLLFDLRPPSLN